MTYVNGTSSSPAARAAESAPTASVMGSTQMDSDTFLKLLVAQLKYQDPTKPTDATQFLSQTAQFSVVQKLDALHALDRQVLDASRNQTAAALIGQRVTYTDVSGNSHTGTVQGTSFGQQVPNLTVDGQVVSLEDVTSVGAVAPPATTT
jgi:flagellar basal-body rod modification protein FlgD